MTQLRDQDEVLVQLAMWPFPGRAFRELTVEERRKVHKKREKLARMLKPVRIDGKKYRTVDVERVIRNSEQ